MTDSRDSLPLMGGVSSHGDGSSASPVQPRQPASNAPEMSVSELSNRLKRTVEDAYGFVRVRGELGRVTIAKSGHMYCDLKDDNSVLNTIMWKGSVNKLDFKPEEGLEVVAEGKLSTYPGRSNYQMIADRMKPAGVGALMQLLEERKKKLAAQGLFSPEHKKPLPYLPQTIGVITSPTGAVIRDILHRIRDRFPCQVYVWPVLVQGEYAAEQVTAAIRGFNNISERARKIKRPDLLIVARGGGSVEDLWPFNAEEIVQAVHDSDIPIISAVGHETDTTLIDYASDKRAPTPTGAAEMAVPVRGELIERVDAFGVRARRGLMRGMETARMEFRAASARMPKPETLVQGVRQRLDYSGEKLALNLKAQVTGHRRRFDRIETRLQPIALQRELIRRRTQLDGTMLRLKTAMKRSVADKAATQSSLVRRYSLQDPRRNFPRLRSEAEARFVTLQAAMRRALERKREGLLAQGRLLSSVSHESVLQRGFVLVQRPTGELVRRAADVESGERLKLQFADDEKRVTADTETPKTKPRIVVRRPAQKKTEDSGQGDLF